MGNVILYQYKECLKLYLYEFKLVIKSEIKAGSCFMHDGGFKM